MHMQRANSTEIQAKAASTVIIVAQRDNARNIITGISLVSRTCADTFATSSFTAWPRQSLEKCRFARPKKSSSRRVQTLCLQPLFFDDGRTKRERESGLAITSTARYAR